MDASDILQKVIWCLLIIIGAFACVNIFDIKPAKAAIDQVVSECQSAISGFRSDKREKAEDSPEPERAEDPPAQSSNRTIKVYSPDPEIYPAIDEANSLLANAGSSLRAAHTDNWLWADVRVYFVDSMPFADGVCAIETGIITISRYPGGGAGSGSHGQVLAHELGHAGGLAHERIPGSLMWPGNLAGLRILPHHLKAFERLPGITPPERLLAAGRYMIASGAGNGLASRSINKQQTTVSCR